LAQASIRAEILAGTGGWLTRGVVALNVSGYLISLRFPRQISA
jgi:hypothetical protein